MSTAWIAVDTDYNNSDCEHRYIFVTVDNIICATKQQRASSKVFSAKFMACV